MNLNFLGKLSFGNSLRWTIGKKLALGFGTVLALMLISAAVTFYEVEEMKKIQDRVIELRIPTAQAGDAMLDGINHSLAALRGYIILGADPEKAEVFKKQRQVAWDNINKSVNKLTKFSKNWTVPANVKIFKDLRTEIDLFRTAQQEVEDIAQSDDNVPAYKLLLTDAAPRAGKMLKAITAIIDEESTLDATPGRKALLKNLADIRGSFAVGLANIRAYMLLGNDQFRSNFQAKWAANEKAFKTINGKLKLFTPTQRKQWNAFAAARSEFALLPPRMFEMRSAPDWNLANAWLGTKTAPRAFAIKQALGKMAKSHKLLVEKDTQALHAAVDLTNFTIITATLVATSLGFFIALFLSRGISRAIGSIVNKINSIQETNDLTQRVEINSNDEFGDLATSFNGFVNTLNDIIVSVDNSANDVASASTQIAASSEQMAAGLNEQNQQVTQISAAIAEMSTSIIEVARKSTDATSSAKKSGKMAHEGGQVVEQTIQGINAISDAVTAGAMSVAELGQRGKQIGKIIDVINDIADQTNLLALNAAIEAARAGEHGRGFAVVADEVRKLADRTTKATEEIGVSIQAIQEETALAIDLMNTGTEQVKTGVDRATEAGENLKQMVTSAQEVASMIQSIAVAAEEQSATSEQVSKNVEMVSAVTRQTNEGSQQAAAAATQLSKRAEELQSLVGRFKTKGA